MFHYNTTTKVSEISVDLTLDIDFLTFKLNWNDTKEYCPQKGMQTPMLKTLNEMKPVSEQLKSRGKGNIG